MTSSVRIIRIRSERSGAERRRRARPIVKKRGDVEKGERRGEREKHIHKKRAKKGEFKKEREVSSHTRACKEHNGAVADRRTPAGTMASILEYALSGKLRRSFVRLFARIFARRAAT